jgi:dUTP pyrophosphatase
MSGYLDITTMVNAFSDVLIVRVFLDTDDNRLRSLYMNRINDHNYSLLNECNKPPHERFINSGFDLYNPTEQIFSSTQVNLIDFKVKCDAVLYSHGPNGVHLKNSGFYIYPRSSLGKSDLRLANNVGIIDAGYRGNIMGLFDYVGDRMEVDRRVCKYDRLLQLCSPTLGPVYIELVDSLNQLSVTERGEGGLGSTGVK